MALDRKTRTRRPSQPFPGMHHVPHLGQWITLIGLPLHPHTDQSPLVQVGVLDLGWKASLVFWRTTCFPGIQHRGLIHSPFGELARAIDSGEQQETVNLSAGRDESTKPRMA